MPTLHVTNIPKARYEALRLRAKRNHRSISAEVLALLETQIPTRAELKKRNDAIDKILQLRKTMRRSTRDNSQSTEEIIREDRER